MTQDNILIVQTCDTKVCAQVDDHDTWVLEHRV